MDKRLAGELIKARQAVKKKYESLRSDIVESELKLREHYKPISEPLKELISSVKEEGSKKINDISQIKVEQGPGLFVSSPPQTTSTPLKTTSSRRRVLKTPAFLEDDTIAESEAELPSVTQSDTNVDMTSSVYKKARKEYEQMTRTMIMDNFLDQFEGLAKEYVDKLIHDTEDEFDVQTGVRYDLMNDKFSIGNKQLDFDGEDVFIMDGNQKVRYKASRGFYELLFKKDPGMYTREDLKKYKDIGARSALFRRNFDPKEQVQGHTGYKYRSVIRELVKPSSEGKGILAFNNKRIEYFPWKDPNMLVTRLRILIASQNAGHTGHNNEITSIVEALKTAKIIK